MNVSSLSECEQVAFRDAKYHRDKVENFQAEVQEKGLPGFKGNISGTVIYDTSKKTCQLIFPGCASADRMSANDAGVYRSDLPLPSPPPSPLPSTSSNVALPPVAVRAKVTGSVTLLGYSKETFGEKEQKAFGAAIAKVVNVAPEFVAVTVKEAKRRHFLAVIGIEVEYVITAANVTAANNMQTTIKSVGSTELTTEFKAAGLTDVTGAIITVSDAVELVDDRVAPPPLPPPPPPLPLPPPPVGLWPPGKAAPPPPSPPPINVEVADSASKGVVANAPRFATTAALSFVVAVAAMILFH